MIYRGVYSLTLTDYNNVLDKFDFKSGNGVTVTKSGNQLRLVSKTAIKNPLVFGASKSLPTVNTVLVPFGDPGIQDVIVGATNASVNAYFKIITKSGSLKLVKTIGYKIWLYEIGNKEKTRWLCKVYRYP